jgi:hypothetical protein
MRGSSNDSWSVARFPSAALRTEFLEHVRLWNRVEGLPKIKTDPMPDGTRVRFWSDDDRHRNIWRLIDSFGGMNGGREEIFSRHALPRKNRWLRPDRPEPVIR